MRVHGMEKDGKSYYVGKFLNGLKEGENGFLRTENDIEYGRFSLDRWVGEGFILTDSRFMCTENNSISVVKTR